MKTAMVVLLLAASASAQPCPARDPDTGACLSVTMIPPHSSVRVSKDALTVQTQRPMQSTAFPDTSLPGVDAHAYYSAPLTLEGDLHVYLTDGTVVICKKAQDEPGYVSCDSQTTVALTCEQRYEQTSRNLREAVTGDHPFSINSQEGAILKTRAFVFNMHMQQACESSDLAFLSAIDTMLYAHHLVPTLADDAAQRKAEQDRVRKELESALEEKR